MFAVIDVETTGFRSSTDRIVEIAVVGVDENGHVEWTWDSLVNPMRDIGPTEVHGIRARDVLQAPTFDQIAGKVAQLLQHRVLIGHNVAFDHRFLRASFERIGASEMPQECVCTMHLAQSMDIRPAKLVDVCSHFHVVNEHPHQALGDALATAEIWRHLVPLLSDQSMEQLLGILQNQPPWPSLTVEEADGVQRNRTAPTTPDGKLRPAVNHQPGYTQRGSLDIPVQSVTGSEAEYCAATQRAVEDRLLDEDEAQSLTALAQELRLTGEQRSRIHQRVLEAQSATAWADGRITDSEMQDLTDLAEVLGLDGRALEIALALPRATPVQESVRLHPGDRIVLTGSMDRPRNYYTHRAEERGLIVTSSVSQKTAALIAADSATQSGKARAARAKGIRVISEHAFERLISDMPVQQPQ